MLQIIKDISFKESDIKKFGIVFSIIFLILSSLLFFFENSLYLFTALFSALLLFFGFFLPVVIKPIYVVWMILGSIMGSLMTSIILTLIFYIILLPMSVIARILNKQFLELNWKKEKNTYWNNRDSMTATKNQYENQF